VSETSYLYELERTTQEIVDAILEAQRHSVGGGNVKIARANQPISLALYQRIEFSLTMMLVMKLSSLTLL
jgi:hypothetical protein